MKGLLHNHIFEFADILKILSTMNYQVTWDIMQSLDHGLAQSRPRIYIVAIRNDSCAANFSFPQKLQVKAPLEKFLDQTPTGRKYPAGLSATALGNYQRAMVKLKKKRVYLSTTTAIVDLAASKKFANLGIGRCPCITASRAAASAYLIVNQGRVLNIKEIARLQGFSTHMIDRLLASRPRVPDRKIAHALGNAMSFNVVHRLLPRVIQAAGLAKHKPKDHLKSKTKQDYQRARILPDDFRGA